MKGKNLEPWEVNEQEFPKDGSPSEKSKFLLRYAILAPSSHNSQPWKFRITEDTIHIFADLDRWLRVADADKRELFVSIGCALENLLVAAEHFGFADQVEYLPERDENLVAVVKLTHQHGVNTKRDPSLFEQITNRHTNHSVYKDKPLSDDEMPRFHDCVFEPGFWLFSTNEGPYPLYSEAELRGRIDELISRADAVQLTDSAYTKELASWVGRGAFGTPWLMAKIGQLAITYLNISKGQTKKDSEMILSAPALVALCSDSDDRKGQILSGQIFERIALTAAGLGVAIHPMSQILEVPETKTELSDLLNVPAAKAKVTGLSSEDTIYPQHTFRLGYADPEPDHTPRRPLEDVLL